MERGGYSREDLAAACAARQVAWMFFHRLFGTPPTAEFLERSCAPEVRECLAFGFGRAEEASRFVGWLDRLSADSGCADLPGIADDYSMIFEAPDMPAIPWEGARGGLGVLFDRETLKVREAYRAFGFEPVLVRRVPDDHIALECAFMGRLCGLSAQGIVEGGFGGIDRGAARLLGAQRDFIDGHLGRWARDFANEVHRAFPESLYAAASAALAAYCELEREFVQGLLDEETRLEAQAGTAGSGRRRKKEE